MPLFVFIEKRLATTPDPTEIDPLLAAMTKIHGQLLPGSWLVEYAGSATDFRAELLSKRSKREPFLVIEIVSLAAHGIVQLDNTLWWRLNNPGLAGSLPLRQGDSPSLPRHGSASFVSHMIALEEELASMAGKYGISDRARHLLANSPLR